MLDSLLLMLHFALYKSKLEWVSVDLNSVTITDSNKLERTQRTIAALCHNTFFPKDTKYHHCNLLERLNLLTLHIKRHHPVAFFLINIFRGAKCSSSVLETVDIRVPSGNIRNFTTLSCSSNHCPSARCVSAANFYYLIIIITIIALQTFVGPWPPFQLVDPIYTVGTTPWTGNQPVARPLPTHRTTQTQNKRTQYTYR
jgi:hypothetical protein